MDMKINKQGVGVYRPEASGRLGGLALAVLLHAGTVVAMWQDQPLRSTISEAAPLMVSLITAPQPVEKPQQRPKPVPVKRKIEPQPPVMPPIMTSATEAPTPLIVSPAPAPALPVDAAVPAASSTQMPAVPAASALPPPVVQPSYNADYLQNPAPFYPPLARRMGQQGKVVLRVLVNPGGAAAQVEVRASSGSELLDAAALDAVRRWRFVPARQGTQPIAAWVLVPITFTLQG